VQHRYDQVTQRTRANVAKARSEAMMSEYGCSATGSQAGGRPGGGRVRRDFVRSPPSATHVPKLSQPMRIWDGARTTATSPDTNTNRNGTNPRPGDTEDTPPDTGCQEEYQRFHPNSQGSSPVHGSDWGTQFVTPAKVTPLKSQKRQYVPHFPPHMLTSPPAKPTPDLPKGIQSLVGSHFDSPGYRLGIVIHTRQ
jgi:hypothetical protein